MTQRNDLMLNTLLLFSLHVIIFAGRFAIGQRKAARDIHCLLSFGTNSSGSRSTTVLSRSFFTYCSTLQKEKDKHRTKLRVSVYRKSGGNAQTSVSVTYPNHRNSEINFLEICSCFRHVSWAEIVYRVYGVFLALKFCQEMFPLRFGRRNFST